MEHRHRGLAGQRVARHPGLLRPGHRDQLLPRRTRAPLRGAGHLPTRVPLPHDLGLEPASGSASSACAVELISPGVDLDTFRPLDDAARRDDMVLALGRSDPLKNLPLTLEAWRRLPEPRPELCLFGHQPELATDPGIRYVLPPSDAEVNELLNAGDGVRPDLDARGILPAGARVDGHRRRRGVHRRPRQPGLLRRRRQLPDARADPRPPSPPRCGRALDDPDLRRRLGEAGRATAAGYDWASRIDALERFMFEITGHDGHSRNRRRARSRVGRRSHGRTSRAMTTGMRAATARSPPRRSAHRAAMM